MFLLIMAQEAEDWELDDTEWEMSENFKEWDAINVLMWIGVLNDDLEDEYSDRFRRHKINGEHFTRDQLGDDAWCRERFGMGINLSKRFSAVVRKRITAYENYLTFSLRPSQCF